MQRFARWHIWLGWIAAIPMLLWMASGLFMAARPIEEVRGNHLLVGEQRAPIAAAAGPLSPRLLEARRSGAFPRSIELEMQPAGGAQDGGVQGARPVAVLSWEDGHVERRDALTGRLLAPLSQAQARALVARSVRGGENISAMRLFEADAVPFDFRRPLPVWQARLADGTHVYVGALSGRIEAVRTRWWRAFDFMWGLHILDPVDREDTSHPLLIVMAALGTIMALLGAILLFRRRKARAKAVAPRG